MRTSPGRGVRCLLAAVLATAAVAACGSADDDSGADPAAVLAGPGGAPAHGTYLALGDSVPFGYIAQFAPGYDDEDVFVGYPEILGRDRGYAVVNLACPGETTASLIAEDAASNGCTNDRGRGEGYRDLHPLHVDYDGSQLEHAVEVLRSTDDVELVTLQIGVNDAFVCGDTGACSDLPGRAALAERVRAGVDTILSTLREAGGYDGRIVVVDYPASDYSDALAATGTEMLDGAIVAAAAAHDADVAGAFEDFRSRAEDAGGSSVRAGLLHADDVHPSARGQQFLADLVAGVLGS